MRGSYPPEPNGGLMRGRRIAHPLHSRRPIEPSPQSGLLRYIRMSGIVSVCCAGVASLTSLAAASCEVSCLGRAGHWLASFPGGSAASVPTGDLGILFWRPFSANEHTMIVVATASLVISTLAFLAWCQVVILTHAARVEMAGRSPMIRAFLLLVIYFVPFLNLTFPSFFLRWALGDRWRERLRGSSFVRLMIWRWVFVTVATFGALTSMHSVVVADIHRSVSVSVIITFIQMGVVHFVLQACLSWAVMLVVPEVTRIVSA